MMHLRKPVCVLPLVSALVAGGVTTVPGTAAGSTQDNVQVQWLLNFNQQPMEKVQTYLPNPKAGEIAPNGGEIRGVLSKGELSLVRLTSGGGALYLRGGDNGLQFKHALSGPRSQILEAVVAVAPETFGLSGEIISINDQGNTNGNMILRRHWKNLKAAARADDGIYQDLAVSDEVLPTDGRFVHVAVVYDNDKGEMSLHIDGKMKTSMPIRLTSGENEPRRGIGMNNGDPSNGFSGYVDAAAESTFTGPFKPGYFRLAKADKSSPRMSAPKSDVALRLPDRIMDLPKVKAPRYVVHKPRGLDDLTYHHGAIISFWKGRCYVAWHTTKRDELTPPYIGFVSSSADLAKWTPAARYASEEDDRAYIAYGKKRYGIARDEQVIVNTAARALHPTKDRLYIWSNDNLEWGQRQWAGRVFYTEDGERWREIPPEELEVFEKERGLIVRGTSANHHFIPLKDGRWMAPSLEGGLAPTTSDPTLLTGWGGGKIDGSACSDIGEPGGWQGPDGTLHYAARNGFCIWHAHSTDGGKTWTKLVPQPAFSDCPGNKEFGMLPDGTVWYVGNPVPGSRDQLVLALSRDGWNFDEAYLVRWEPMQQLYPAPYKGGVGYQYPSATYHDGKLYVAYSVARDFIEVSVVDVSKMMRKGAVITTRETP